MLLSFLKIFFKNVVRHRLFTLIDIVRLAIGLVALCIAWVTVGGTAALAASRKRVLALRYE